MEPVTGAGLVEASLVIDVVGQHGTAQFYGRRRLDADNGAVGFWLPFEGVVAPDGAISWLGQLGPNNARLEGHIGVTSGGRLSGTVNKDGLDIQWNAQVISPDEDGRYPCRGSVCVDQCVAARDCSDDKVCAPHPSRHLPRVCTTSPEDSWSEARRYLIMLLSTEPDSRCRSEVVAGLPAPGADLIEVSLEHEGEVMSYGEVHYSDGATRLNGYRDPTILGQASATCAAGSESMYSLGCGGTHTIVSFPDPHDQLSVALEDDMKIRIVEHDDVCGDDAGGEEYEVWLCTDTRAVLSDHDVASCTIALGRGLSGSTIVNVRTE